MIGTARCRQVTLPRVGTVIGDHGARKSRAALPVCPRAATSATASASQ